MFLPQPIGLIYRHIAKPTLFKFDPEFVHQRISKVGHLLGRFALGRALTSALFNYRNPMLEQEVAGIRFINPIGLSAGFDKNAELVNILPAVGFGFMEIGSVTYEAYAGNPAPRLFRLPKSKALVVYYGLMNIGVHKIVDRIKRSFKSKAIVGISVAKTNCSRTSEEAAGIEDYFACLNYLEQQQAGDYYTINISCPNTFGGEPFTTEQKLERLLSRLSILTIRKPVFVKMPINLPLAEFDKLLQVVIKYKLTGVVIGNLTKVRDPELIHDTIPEHVKGGISGKPTETLCNELISYTYQKYSKHLVIIGVGGIFSATDAYEKIKRGASLLQLITGMIFQGPQLIGQINFELTKLLEADGYSNVKDAVGSYFK
jgi:dihydroorotate dehydrogenase subfamily 2